MPRINLVILLCGIALHAQPTTTREAAEWIQSWPDRAIRLEQWRALPASVRSKEQDAAIATLVNEVRNMKALAVPEESGIGDGYGNYFIGLALFVAEFKDPAVIPALIKVIDVAPKISTALAAFGDLAVAPVLSVISDSARSPSAIFALGKLIQGQNERRCQVSIENRQTIRIALMTKARESRSYQDRYQSIEALANFGDDTEVRALISEVALHDVYQVRATPSGETWFPVQEAARRALRKISEEKVRK